MDLNSGISTADVGDTFVRQSVGLVVVLIVVGAVEWAQTVGPSQEAHCTQRYFQFRATGNCDRTDGLVHAVPFHRHLQHRTHSEKNVIDVTQIVDASGLFQEGVADP